MYRPFVTLCIQRVLLCACLAAGALLSACAPMEPIKGCTLAAANHRETLRARAYLHGAIPARILVLHYAGSGLAHTALVYRLPEGWCVYDDTFGTRQVKVPTDRSGFPQPLLAARAASPGRSVDAARWFDDTPSASAKVLSTGYVNQL